MKKYIVLGLLVAFGIGLGIVGYVGFRVYIFLSTPPQQQAVEKIVVIDRGMSLHLVAERLKEHEVITDQNLFMILARFYQQGKSIKAGEYKLTTAMLPLEVLNVLQAGKILLRSVTIPEGYTAEQIADLLDHLGFAHKDTFLKLTFTRQLAAELKIEADNLEGYLFPNTYSISREMNEEAIIREMVTEFWQVITPDLLVEIRQKGFTVHEIVTLASIIEKEARVGNEREVISAVYHNRLKINMKLDSDPTVIYGIENFNGNLTKIDLQSNSPYNTYTHRGLPPGPIANPGKASILAAIHPANVKYLYFVARNDGTHEFSENYAAHLLAVRKYQKNK
jgi:UPF0755 protein